MRRRAVAGLALPVVAGVLALGLAGPRPAEASAADSVAPAVPGQVTASVGLLEVHGRTGTGYLTLHNATDEQVVVQAAVSPAAASVLWTTNHPTITSAHLFTASSLCENETSLDAEADAAAREMHDLVLDPGGTLALVQGTGSFELTGLIGRFPAGDRVPLTIFLTGDREVRTELVVA